MKIHENFVDFHLAIRSGKHFIQKGDIMSCRFFCASSWTCAFGRPEMDECANTENPLQTECDLREEFESQGLTSTECELVGLEDRDELTQENVSRHLMETTRFFDCLGCGGTVEVFTVPGCRWELHTNCCDHRELFLMND